VISQRGLLLAPRMIATYSMMSTPKVMKTAAVVGMT
jgi:hypothetical protein